MTNDNANLQAIQPVRVSVQIVVVAGAVYVRAVYLLGEEVVAVVWGDRFELPTAPRKEVMN